MGVHSVQIAITFVTHLSPVLHFVSEAVNRFAVLIICSACFLYETQNRAEMGEPGKYFFSKVFNFKWDKVFNNGLSKTCERHSLKN